METVLEFILCAAEPLTQTRGDRMVEKRIPRRLKE